MPKIKDAEWKNHSSDNTSKAGSLEGTGNRSGHSSVPDAPQGGYIQRINNDAREDEMEENMQAVGSMLGNLKNMAQDMGEEISKQNKQTDRILDKTEKNSKTVDNANVRAQKLLK
jgi:synaptosomal-associated protein 23